MDWSADTPPTARDIAAYYRQEIANGSLAPLRQLPSARSLAKKLRVATMTVQGAYAQLRDEGLVDTRQGSGTFVRDAASNAPSAQQSALGLRELQDQVERVTARLAELSDRVARLEAGEAPPAGPDQ
ncbi:GntR family transcriptional regulator [Streptomyces sp. TS71-3]|uniref:GntR family transcriptional regulator n=1 Tax=Streptomyces sp. TS71-3 TaxID=2733862 RepID=UPI001B137B1F|nr:winged helix-turn-helix domain-containing protein [Streptomyces sp. TS71-3]GHJ36031.1 GntR family transcriptional regulator [Streptomyces sp. TS71-3]